MTPNNKSILIVDDDETVLETVAGYLSLKGYSVRKAETGKEAIDESNKHFFNLAILDIKLPDVEGTELLTRLRETEPKMKKIMLTGHGDFDNAVKSLKDKADFYTVKPVEFRELLSVIEEKLKEQDAELKMDRKKLVTYLETREKESDHKNKKTR
jgi:DNA-binding NtrC family response regulator